MELLDVKSMDIGELKQLTADLELPAFHAEQIFRWFARGASDFDEMSDLSKAAREKLKARCRIFRPRLAASRTSVDGTVKFLWELAGGDCVESVFMRYRHGNSLCISTQAGCRMGCAFCASTRLGLSRNLTAGEMLDEVVFAQAETGLRVDSLVLMGTGEPLDNFDNVLKFISLVTSPDGVRLGARHISLSTCGLVPGIRRLAEKDLPITLSVSLHAPTDELRDRLMPVNRAHPLAELIPACRDYFAKTGRRISFEYAMIDGVNDTEECAQQLADLLEGLPAHINLILLNRIKESPLRPSDRAQVQRFVAALEKRGRNVTIRRRMGRDIDAACGQLRRSVLEAKREEEGHEDLGEK